MSEKKEDFFFSFLLITNNISFVVFFIYSCQSVSKDTIVPILQMWELRHREMACPQPLRKPVAENK